MKRICALTMARNDAFFLKKWISYYSEQLGEENLYVFLDGEDQSLPYDTGKVNVVVRKRVSQEVTVADRTRIGFLNEQAHLLLQRYDLVIGSDADELLVVDPKVGESLVEYLSHAKCNPCISGLGVDVGHHLKEEQPIDGSKPFLSQRKYALMDSQYTKPVVVDGVTSNLLSGNLLLPTASDGCKAQVMILASAIQAQGTDGTLLAYENAWGQDTPIGQ